MLPRRHPREGGKVLPAWQHEKVEPGSSFAAWKTGEAYWCEVHHQVRSVPCVAIMTDGAIACSVDHGRYPLRWIGYQPLIRETGQPVCVVVQGYSFEQVEQIQVGNEVIVKRDKGRNKPIQLLKATSARSFKGFETRRVVAAEFEQWLLKFWGDSSLLSCFSSPSPSFVASAKSSDNALSLTEVQPRITTRVFDPTAPETVGNVIDRHKLNGHK